ncbi:MAG: hypothetical protein HSCHL_2009 [Hydrogenibacillus schlegelii]|uniref:Uncharacterized protein n=1 Tax=Hydrogenibacillus schlegelii TaxID=1484 RepID=A0A2T5GBF2_HYDSH|nr:MAG: hypothetical protein HSCHL_2009 [Hydrogenibacillus schlegelii]
MPVFGRVPGVSASPDPSRERGVFHPSRGATKRRAFRPWLDRRTGGAGRRSPDGPSPLFGR